ncbi:MAG TPA: hypothetical protein VMH00_13810 [Candidatus Limnocylindrales bacterium]|nr:hypothetical protein [Candidatus Limnocylindrales bacterium]
MQRRSFIVKQFVVAAAFAACTGLLCVRAEFAHAQGQTVSPTTWSVTVVLPPRLIAGGPATLATLGVNGKLAPNITVMLGSKDVVRTDVTGRAFFNVPASGGVLLAHAAGSSAAALIDSSAASTAQKQMTVPPVVSLHDHFSICGGGFRGDAEADHVRVDGAPALILASSPECLVVIAGPKTPPGPAKISVDTPVVEREAASTFVALSFEPPQPALTPEKKGWLTVRARGFDQPLRILVTNETPGVLQFEKGEWQEVTTSGGAENIAQIRVEAIRSGDFSFNARLSGGHDVDTARRFLEAAEPLATEDVRGDVRSMARDLARHPRNADKVGARLAQLLRVTMAGDFRTLLEAAQSAL